VIVKGKGAHHPADAIGIGQMEGCGHLVLPGGLVVQHGARIPLVVMVVYKGQGLSRGQESPAGAPEISAFYR